MGPRRHLSTDGTPLPRSEIIENDLLLATTFGHDQKWEGALQLPCPSEEEESRVHDQFEVTLEDSDLLGEVELTTNLIIAASEADERLTDEEIDRILGVTRD